MIYLIEIFIFLYLAFYAWNERLVVSEPNFIASGGGDGFQLIIFTLGFVHHGKAILSSNWCLHLWPPCLFPCFI